MYILRLLSRLPNPPPIIASSPHSFSFLATFQIPKLGLVAIIDRSLGRNGTSLNTWGSMFNFLLPFLAKKEHLCVPDCSSSRGTSLHGVYALSTLVHAPQSWPLSRKQITPVLAIVNFFFAHTVDVLNSFAAPCIAPVSSANPGTEQSTTRKGKRVEQKKIVRRSIDQGL